MDADISVPIERLQIQGNISVFNLTSRLSASEGLIAVGVDVIGWFGLPSRNTEIEALTSEGVPLATSRTGANGTAMFTTLKLQEYPGMYDIYFRPKGQSDVAAKLIVNITGCPIGNVKADTGKACIRCTRGYYSFNPENTTCDVCPANAGECCAVRCGAAAVTRELSVSCGSQLHMVASVTKCWCARLQQLNTLCPLNAPRVSHQGCCTPTLLILLPARLAECPGQEKVLPLTGFWSSSDRSTQIHR